MKAVNTALVSRLGADADLRAIAGLASVAIANELAVGTTANPIVFPYILFQKQSGVDDFVQGDTGPIDLLYLVKAIDKSTSGARADDMSERVYTLLSLKPLTVAGFRTSFVHRRSHISYTENDNGVVYKHRGGLYALRLVFLS